MTAPDPNSSAVAGDSPGSSRNRWVLVVPIAGGLLLILAAVVILLVVMIRGLISGIGPGPGTSLSVIKVTPLPVSPLVIPGCDTVISSDDVWTAASLPVSLSLGDRSFRVVAAPSRQGEWTHPVDESGAATWLCGTVVNYVVALAPTERNEALLADLRLGDEIRLYLANGRMLVFRFSERLATASDDPALYEQTHPRVTLILAGEGDGWQILRADYATETPPSQSPAGALAQPRQPVQLSGVEVTLLESYVVRGDPGLAPGTMYYLVDFEVRNTGSVALNADVFDMQLQDGLGSRYLLSPAAGAAGRLGPVGGQVSPGAVVQGTAGYLVPETLAGPALIWSFRPLPGAELCASVSVSHTQVTPEPVQAGRAQASITAAFLDGDVLLIEGEVRNSGTGPLTVEQGDVGLSSNAGASYLRMAAPPLPWVIEPGRVQIVELQYDRPGASAVVLSLAGYSFEISGLQ